MSTLANGVVAFMLYGLAFIGGWVETVGSLLRNDAAVNIGIVSSLLVPIEAVFRKAALQFQPLQLGSTNFAGPFVVTHLSRARAMMIYAGLVYCWVAVASCLEFRPKRPLSRF